MIPRYRLFSQRIANELADIRRAADKAQQAAHHASLGGADETFYLDSTALNLHAFYNGVERLFEWLARELDDAHPRGSSWHRELLEQMTTEVPEVRPAIISVETHKALDEYLRFRHLVRNLYTWDFVPARIAELIARLPATLQLLANDLARFRQFLDTASHADE
jgi:hypothetical protein